VAPKPIVLTMKTLRLILGDQLNYNHSWFKQTDEKTIYFMSEMRQETDYVVHHIQKVVGFFESMRNFAIHLEEKGHRVIYYKINATENTQNLINNLENICEENEITNFEYQLPDEYRLDKQLKDYCAKSSLKTKAYDTEHFFTKRDELTDFFKGKKQMIMEYFYRDMRKKHGILMQTDKDPEGGQWNFDQNNRKQWKGEPSVPQALSFNIDVSKTLEEIIIADIKTIGRIDAKNFQWPTSRKESLDLLNYFCEKLLPYFGDFQDALHTDENFLFHSRLSFALNTKMLHPAEVVERVISHWRDHKDYIEISQVEGFVRQILGWREFMRGIYWKEMPDYANKNILENTNNLPEFFWNAETKMNCLHHAIKQSLEHSYAHHIQRLMITGNYVLLTQTHPDEVDKWYLGIYIDAIEWVEITNTRGMSQFADGGIVATKPYVSSGNYINKMSNYCKNCHYNVKKSKEEDACPFNALYWNFLDDKRTHFKNNNRMAMMINLLNKKPAKELQALKIKAQHIIQNPNLY
jgi:deoxyribodipyrimidine photolyase-related protein